MMATSKQEKSASYSSGTISRAGWVRGGTVTTTDAAAPTFTMDLLSAADAEALGQARRLAAWRLAFRVEGNRLLRLDPGRGMSDRTWVCDWAGRTGVR